MQSVSLSNPRTGLELQYGIVLESHDLKLWQMSYSILKTVQNRDIVQLKTNSKSYGARLAPAVPVTLNDPKVIRLLQALRILWCYFS